MKETQMLALSALTEDQLRSIHGGDADPCGSQGAQSFAFRVGQGLSHLGEYIAGFVRGISDPTPCN